MRPVSPFLLTLTVMFCGSAVQAQTRYEVQRPPLDTDWTYSVGTDPWPEYPRPQLRRDEWHSLNGLWTWRASSGDDVNDPPRPGNLDHEVLVPSCIESGLSGLQILDVHRMWYETTFDVPQYWDGQRVLLNFEAVDYEAHVYINQQKLEHHVGGYARFTIDVTDSIKYGESNDLLVYVADPTDSENIPVGKQSLEPSHIFYRPCSGIWQSVWIEPAPKEYIARLDVAAYGDGKVVVTVVSSSGENEPVELSVLDSFGRKLAGGRGTADQPFEFYVDEPELWSPESPRLYDVVSELGEDVVKSYTGFRTISKGEVEGVVRPLLNGKFVFQLGTLDQGYWPDGLYTPPSLEAMVYDLQVLKDMGFNMVRKHIKIEPDLFYEACDKIGLLVMQDMPSLPPPAQPNAEEAQEFQRQLELMVYEHRSYPSIYSWVIFNEGWGQLDDAAPEGRYVQIVRQLDPSRLVNAVSGWDDHGYGDFDDWHSYPNAHCGIFDPDTPTLGQSEGYDGKRIGFQGEFGGVGHNLTIDHLWNVSQAINQIKETYEVAPSISAWNLRTSDLLVQLRDHVRRYSCSGAVYTQTTDVEGEVNGLLSYDRRIFRPRLEQWRSNIRGLYKEAAKREGKVVK